jgi:hypothetical protein
MTTAISVERVGDLWANWQRANPEEAKDYTERLTTRMIVGNARKTIAGHICFVADKIGVDKVVVSEYVRRHRHD